MTRVSRRRILAAVLVIGTGGAVGAYVLHRPPADARVAGMVRQTEVRIAPEVTGRLVAVPVRSGDRARKGDLLAVIDNPDLSAALGEARAAAASARADRARVYSGVRAEEIAIRAEAVRTAKANLDLARLQDQRTSALASRGYASQQQLDQDTASLAKAEADLALKQAQHAEAIAGPTPQERTLADARLALAEASVVVLETQLAKTRLTAPADGTVRVEVAAPGEIIAPGRPVMTFAPDGGTWFSFTAREDRLAGVAVGGPLVLEAAGGKAIPARVTALLPLGEFATWRAARAAGDHDLNSFRLRVEPDGNGGAYSLESGMTVFLPPTPSARP
ncbi:unknown protein [Azorhizobium caulinodans ORS 571]|uniref:YbhG-like alpha-helical hairpin domain-containing protein n=1 Tax=Azorhizobium caulinodans (strain ATCC 43989 / DSM 5975 / JCM 20966 / LMG 6465 / NBRC 14845 / NCIMB 13405 / ORS 571) TaxID=438753 RepID=A8I3Q2_AZOC5|nr:biotin/lipoyl-binding protein [Azorhizobium caulinodans]BAF87639.1 unknown protein [Azorhizobium caulinodans ORS 571]